MGQNKVVTFTNLSGFINENMQRRYSNYDYKNWSPFVFEEPYEMLPFGLGAPLF